MNKTSDSETERRRVRGRRLTDRQTKVLELVAEGLENKEIGHRMGISEQAVKEHVSALLHRLAVRNRAALAEIATELKIAGTMALPPEWLGYIYDQSPVADVSSESAEPYRLRDAATGRDLPPVEGALSRALKGEPVHDLRIRMFLPALGRDASVRIDAQPLVVAEGVVRGVIAAITEVVQDPLMA